VVRDQDAVAPTAENPFPDLNPGKSLPIVVRASNGKSKRDRSEKVKLVTVVQPDDLEAFYIRYAEVCKAGMTALKPRDRSKKKAKAKKKKATA
jgi:signal recognition particle subunit SRP14